MILKRDLFILPSARAEQQRLLNKYKSASGGYNEALYDFIDDHSNSVNQLSLYFISNRLRFLLEVSGAAKIVATLPYDEAFDRKILRSDVEYVVTSMNNIEPILSKLQEISENSNSGSLLDVKPGQYNGNTSLLSFNDFILKLEDMVQEFLTRKFVYVFNSATLAKKLKLEERQTIDAMNKVTKILSSVDLTSGEKMNEILALQDKTLNPESFEFFKEVISKS